MRSKREPSNRTVREKTMAAGADGRRIGETCGGEKRIWGWTKAERQVCHNRVIVWVSGNRGDRRAWRRNSNSGGSSREAFERVV